MQENKLATERLGKLLVSLAVPSIIAQLVNILYNLVDRMYIGRMEDGTLAMSAISVSLPVVTFILAVTMLFGAGGAPIAAIKMGEGKHEEAEKTMANSFLALVVSAIVMTVIIEVFHEPLLYLFGAHPTNIEMASQYVMIYGLGTVFVQIAFGMNPYINTQGFAMFGMVTVLIGAVLNIILDPILIFGLDMGVRGAALATIVSQAVSAIWCLWFLLGKKTLLKLRWTKPDWKLLGAIVALGSSPFIMNATESLLQIAFNNQLLRYGGTLAVGTISILASLAQLISLPLQGLAQGAQPITSYNYGAGNFVRVRKTFRLLFVVSVAFSVLGVGTILLFPRFFAGLFTNDPELIASAGWAIRPYLTGFLIFGAQIACQQSFVALGQAKQSLAMALFRKVVVLIPLLYLMPAVLGNTGLMQAMSESVAALFTDQARVAAVLSAESVADAAAAITTTTLFLHFYKKHLYSKKTEV